MAPRSSRREGYENLSLVTNYYIIFLDEIYCLFQAAYGDLFFSFAQCSYQVSVFNIAVQRNTIAVLETGSGKTMIAVMLMKELGKEIEIGCRRKLLVFLAPTVHLVNQVLVLVFIYFGLRMTENFSKLKCLRSCF